MGFGTAYRGRIYKIKDNENPYQMQAKSCSFDKYVCLNMPLNLDIFQKNLEGILRTFSETMGKYRILHEICWV